MNNYILPFLWMKGEDACVIQREIEKIYECGIGAVCLESRPHPDFMGEKWWADMELIISECKKRDMKIWILDDTHFPTGYANGLVKEKYPERRKWYLAYSTCDVWGARGEASLEVSRIMHPTFSFLDLGKPGNPEEEKNNELISVTAYRLVQGRDVDECSAIELTDKVEDGWLHITLPEGSWRVFVIYKTRNGGENSDYLNPIDREAASTLIEAIYEPHYEHLREEFGKTIAGFFSDEPGFYNKGGFDMDERIGRKEMVLPWSDSADERMEQACGAGYKMLLPLLWSPSVQDKKAAWIRYHYMDVVSELYSECFCRQIGDWCEAHGVEYIGHVLEDDNVHARLGAGAGHYFRAVSGQHMAGIDVISQQISCGGAGLETGGVFRRDCEFNHYALGKMGASSGHLEPKKQGRTMCELFGAYGWKLGTRDMKWILDHLLTKGVNYFVPHAFSMSEYPDMDCPPHFYAGGNYAQFDAFAKLMKYANRMCDLLNGGLHVAKTAILYHGEHEWAGEAMLMQKPARELIRRQIEFDIVTLDMLEFPENYNGRFEKNQFEINGVTFASLIVPYAEKISGRLWKFHRKYPEIPIIFVDDYPKSIADRLNGEDGKSGCDAHEIYGDNRRQIDGDGRGHTEESEINWPGLDESIRKCPLGELAEYMISLGAEEIRLEHEFPDMAYYHYKKDTDYYLFHNENMYHSYEGDILLPLKRGAVLYDGMEDEYYALRTEPAGALTRVRVEIPIYGMCMILDKEPDAGMKKAVYSSEEIASCSTCIDISGGWSYSLRKHTSGNCGFAGTGRPAVQGRMDTLVPMSRLYPGFSGHICYEKEIVVDEMPDIAYLEFQYIFETAEVYINDRPAGMLLCPPYRFEIGGLLVKGNNHIRVDVTTTMDRDQIGRPEPMFTLDYQAAEATGMYGTVKLILGV